MRRHLSCAAALSVPSAASAEVCEAVRPSWVPGTAVSSVDEAILLLSAPASLGLVAATALALRFRSQWGALACVVGWTIWASVIVMGRDTGVQAQAIAEGCMGSPALFITLAAAICVTAILYTRPRVARAD
ncbi:hypothetical protein [Anianabacter salinae]|uniref:hypothetical protein n=1 Tax=Anianabacter salinae TaxID=2851023 RepID=UPI00225E4816|nr:hypothetical protein [Anianabacter salinae]MBV0910801.1 hypothetical protein [Anianabacter salinae]